MSGVNWSLGVMPDVGGAFMQAYERGREQKRQTQAHNALSTYATDPTPQNLNALAPFAPEFVIRERTSQATAQRDQRQTQMQQIGRLLRHAKDENTWQQAMGAARRLGLDVSDAPANYDPNYVSQSLMMLEAFEKDGGQSLSNAGKIAQEMGFSPGTPEFNKKVEQIWMAEQNKTIPYTQGGGVAGYNAATGQTFTIIQPNPGGYETGAPVGSRPAPQGAPDLPPGFQLDGGPTPPASGNFRP